MTTNKQADVYDRLLNLRLMSFPGVMALVLTVLGLVIAIYHLHTAFFGQPTVMVYRSISFNLFMAAAFLLYPLRRKPFYQERFIAMIPDILCVLFVVFIQIYILADMDAFMERRGSPNPADIILGTIYIGLVVEITRRTVGLTLALLVLVFFFQSFLSHHLFGIFYGPPITYADLIDNLFLQEQGIFGIPVMVMADYIYLFILFGIFLVYAGAGEFFMDLAYGLTRGQVGGPAKASVLSSMLLSLIHI